MQRFTCLIVLLASACTALPLFGLTGSAETASAKTAQAKTIALTPASRSSLSTILPPSAPAALPLVQRPAGHLDARSLAPAHFLTPQVSDPRALYARSAGDSGARVENGVVVCSVRVTGHGYDDGFFSGGADVYMTLRVGAGAVRRTRQTSRRIYSFPVALLEQGDALRVRVLDEDTFSDDLIGEGRAVYHGSAIAIPTHGAEVSCRIAHGRTVERARVQAFRRIRREVDHMEGASPELSAYDFGYPGERAAAVSSAFQDALAWMQPFDEELETHLDGARAAEERWEDETREAVDAALIELPAPGSAVTLARTGSLNAELACGAEARRMREELGDVLDPSAGCLVRLEIQFRRGVALAPAGPGSLEVWGIDGSASMLPASVVGRRRGVDWLSPVPGIEALSFRPGEQLTYVYAIPAGTRPALLRIGRDRRATVIRLE